MQETVSHRPRPRQDPVSCESCRKKKLKCDRQLPCANCTSRGVTCEYQGRVPTASGSMSSDPDEVNALRRENAAIKARIDRLEELIYSGSSSFETSERPSKARRLERGFQTQISPSTTLTGSPQSEATRGYSRDVQWLEGVGESSYLHAYAKSFKHATQSICPSTLACSYFPLRKVTTEIMSSPGHDPSRSSTDEQLSDALGLLRLENLLNPMLGTM